jgi:hypothetical protein
MVFGYAHGTARRNPPCTCYLISARQWPGWVSHRKRPTSLANGKRLHRDTLDPMRSLMLVAVCILGSLQPRLAAAEAVPLGASPEELFAFKMLNAWRADPDRFDIATSDAIDLGAIDGHPRTWGAYIGKMTKAKSPMPPIAWSAELATVAQASLARWKPSAQGAPHNPAADFAAAKVAKPSGATLALSEGHGDLRQLFAAAMAHPTETTNHGPVAHTRESLMAKEVTCCGVAIAKSGRHFKLAVVFSTQPLARAAYGAAYRDANRNGELDPGEPLVTAELTIAGSDKMQAKAGLWSLAVGEGATEVACTVDGLTRTVAIPAGRSCVWLPMAVAEKNDVGEVNRLLALAAKVVPLPDEDTPDKTAFDLYFRMQRARLDDQTAKAAQQAVAEVSTYVERGRKEFIGAIGEDKAMLTKRLDEIEKRWRKRGPAWIAFGKTYVQISKEYRAWSLLKPGDAKTAGARELSRSIDKQVASFTDAELWMQLLSWKTEVDLHAYAAERGGGSGKR